MGAITIRREGCGHAMLWENSCFVGRTEDGVPTLEQDVINLAATLLVAGRAENKQARGVAASQQDYAGCT